MILCYLNEFVPQNYLMEFFVSATVNWSHASNAVSFSRNVYAKTTRSSFIETCPNFDNRFVFFFLGKTLVSWDSILRIWAIARRSQLVCHFRTFHLCGAYDLKQTRASAELCSEFGKQFRAENARLDYLCLQFPILGKMHTYGQAPRRYCLSGYDVGRWINLA